MVAIRRALSVIVVVALSQLAGTRMLASAFPLTLTGDLGGAAYVINVPLNWNGTLVVYQHGYRDVADHPGEIEDHSAHFDPPALAAFLQSQGYATAASAFTVNGYNIEEGVRDTKTLIEYFRDAVGPPQRTILYGVSGGATMSAAALEGGHGLYDGAVGACGVMAGTPLFFDRELVFMLAYQAAFGVPASWGTPGDVRDDLDFDTEVRPIVLPQVMNPANFGRFEFIRLVAGLPSAGFYPGAVLTHMFFNTEARAQLERKFGGAGVQNLDHSYSLSAGDQSYLSSLGVDSATLLGGMNASRIYAAVPSVRRAMEKWAALDGKIKKPLLTMHAKFDTLATPDNETVYRDKVDAADRSDNLMQVFTNGVGHCTFTAPQAFAAIQALESWIDTGAKPALTFFPASAGFVHDFTPPAWPYPVQ